MIPATLVDQAQKFRRWYRDAGARRCSRTSTRSSRRRRPAPRRGSASRPSCSTASRCRCARTSASSPSRSRSSACRSSRCRSRLTRCRSACRSSPRRGARTSRCGSRTRSSNAGVAAAPVRAIRRSQDVEIDLPEVVAEVTAAFDRYEQALVIERRRDARRDVPRRSAHHPLRRRREPLRLWTRSTPSAPRARRSAWRARSRRP